MPSVLFVCTANRFRSPLASAFFKNELDQNSAAAQWTVDSAGTWAERGLPPLPEASLIARKYDLDLTRHRSKPVTASLLTAQDLILVMEAGQREALQNEFPAIGGRVHLLSWAAERRNYDIPDTIHSLDAMLEVSAVLHDLIHKGFSNICELAAQFHR
ncbi:MAG: low molecular weight phosphotyrosine protein phosphatase [Chloroflexota bacterium]